jgi:hypothetical protein
MSKQEIVGENTNVRKRAVYLKTKIWRAASTKNYSSRLSAPREPIARLRAGKRRASVHHGSMLDRALHEFTPWTLDKYPGLIRYAQALFRYRVSYEGIRNWRRGNRPMPEWACTLLADFLEAKASRLTSLAAQLREAASEAAGRHSARSAAARNELFKINSRQAGKKAAE